MRSVSAGSYARLTTVGMRMLLALNSGSTLRFALNSGSTLRFDRTGQNLTAELLQSVVFYDAWLKVNIEIECLADHYTKL
jgi:hypothetical protein